MIDVILYMYVLYMYVETTLAYFITVETCHDTFLLRFFDCISFKISNTILSSTFICCARIDEYCYG